MEKRHAHKKTYYNDIALRLAQKLLGIEHLHYGYFTKTMPVALSHFQKAQDKYVENLISFIPKSGIKKVFDVGCGTGGVATHLVKKKYDVTCLAPDPFMTEKAFENTKGRVSTITDLYENVDDLPPESFDMVLMSESAQYIKVTEGWEQNRKYVRKGGYVLVADFFKIKELDNPNLSKSGHNLQAYLDAAEAAGFKLVKKSDISAFVAPTMDIYQSLILDKVFPVVGALGEFVERRYPLTYKALRALLSKHIEKIHAKYSAQDSATFLKYKAYMVLLFQRKA